MTTIYCDGCGTVCESCVVRDLEVKRLRRELRRYRAWLRHVMDRCREKYPHTLMLAELTGATMGKPAPRKGKAPR